MCAQLHVFVMAVSHSDHVAILTYDCLFHLCESVVVSGEVYRNNLKGCCMLYLHLYLAYISPPFIFPRHSSVKPVSVFDHSKPACGLESLRIGTCLALAKKNFQSQYTVSQKNDTDVAHYSIT